MDDGHIPTPQTMAAICSYFTFSNEIVENIFFDMWFSTEYGLGGCKVKWEKYYVILLHTTSVKYSIFERNK